MRQETLKAVLDVLDVTEWVTAMEIAVRAGITRSRSFRVIKVLRELGMIEQSEVSFTNSNGHGNSQFKYRLPSPDRNEPLYPAPAMDCGALAAVFGNYTYRS